MTFTDELIDRTALVLLANHAPIPLGIKASLMEHYLKRPDYPISPERLVGMADNDEENFSLLSDYTDRVGYQFHWGVVTEEYRNAIPDSGNDWEQEVSLSYEAIPEKLLAQFQRADIFDFVFGAMYVKHPLATDRYLCGVGSDHQAVHDFYAYGESEVKALRNFMCEVFLPVILPDLLATLEALLALRNTDESQFDARCAEWQTGRLGTEDLVLLSPVYEIPVSTFSAVTNLPEYLADFTDRRIESEVTKSETCVGAAISTGMSHHRGRVTDNYLGADHAPIEISPEHQRSSSVERINESRKLYCGPIPVNLGTIAEKHTDGSWTRDNQPGYRFDWGYMVEDFSPADPACQADEILGQDNVQYTIVVDALYKAFGRPLRPLHEGGDELETFFCDMYYKHPLHHSHYGWEDPILENGVISFIGVGQAELIELRQWIFDVFVPKILPDMTATLNHLVALRKENEAEFLTEFGKWLTGNDETKLVFVDSAVSTSDLVH